jgi:ATP-dependent Lhr-like helicase
MSVHDEVRQEMYQVYVQGDYRINVGDNYLDFLDSTAKELFSEGLKIFRDLNLKENFIISQGKSVFIIPWLGDKIVLTLKYLFIKHEYKSITEYGGIIEIQDVQESEIINTLKKMITDHKVTNTDLAEIIIQREVKHLEKYDYLLPEPLLNLGFGAKVFDVNGALKWITNLGL